MAFLNKLKIIKSYWPISKFYFRSLLHQNQPLLNLFFQITNRCNARCLMCFNWQRINQKNEEFSLEEIDKFSKTLGQLSALTLGGGEPFLRQDIAEICQIFAKNNSIKKIVIPTNCLLNDRIIDLTNRIASSYSVKLRIVLSLDGLGKIHDEIRGVEGNFDKVIEVHHKLNDLAKKHSNLYIGINTTVSDKNQDHIAELIDFVDKNLSVKSHTVEVIRGCYNQKNVSPPSWEKYQELIKQILSSQTINKDRYYKAVYSYYHHLALEILGKKKQLIPCRASSFMPVIDASGNVYHCELLPSIGNLRDSNFDFLKIWHSEKAKQQRKDIAHKKCYCTHFCYQVQNIPMSPIHFIKAVLKAK